MLRDEHGSGGLFGWSALALAILIVLAVGAEQRGEPVVAGLVAVSGSSAGPRPPLKKES